MISRTSTERAISRKAISTRFAPRSTGTSPNSATESSPTQRCTAAQAQLSLPTKWHRSRKLITTDQVLPGSGRLATSLSSSSTASFTGPRCGQGGGPPGLARRGPWAGPAARAPHRTGRRTPRRRRCGGCCTRPRPAPAGILSLDVADLDLANRRARLRSKAARPGVFWQTRTTAAATPDSSPAEVRGQVSEEDHSCDQTASDGHDVTSVNAGVSVRGRAMNCVSQRLRGDTADSAGRLIGPQRRSHGGLTGVVRTGGSP